MLQLLKKVCVFIYANTAGKLIKRIKIARLLRDNEDIVAPFKEAMREYADKSYSAASVFISSYKEKTVNKIKPGKNHSSDNLVLLCIVKNDLERIKTQIDYHKKHGVDNFAYVDNDSTDGTFEWLTEQEDISLFSVKETFHPVKKNAWLKQAMDVLGYNRWYLVIDSDEFFAFPGIEDINIPCYIKHLQDEGIRSAHTMAVDMYPKDKIYKDDGKPFLDSHCYFDTSTYWVENERIAGGPRPRVYNSNDIYNGKYGRHIMTTHRLIYAQSDIISTPHVNYPQNKYSQNKLPTAFLRHYKLLPIDYIKINDYDFIKNHAGEGKKRIMAAEAHHKNPNLSFWYEGSQKYNTSMDLLKIRPIDEEFFDGFIKNIHIKK